MRLAVGLQMRLTSRLPQGGPMRRLFYASALFVGMFVAIHQTTAVSVVASSHKWRFDPTVNVPWAHEDDDQDTTDSGASLCLSNPFNLTNAYAALGANVDVI